MRVVLHFFRCLRNFEEANAKATLADYCVEKRSYSRKVKINGIFSV